MTQSANPDHAEARQRLERRQAELRALLQDAAGAAIHAADRPGDISDFKDLAEEEAQHALDDAATAQAARELADIGAALRRIQDGSYGVCAGCAGPIAPARLAAVPAAAFCTACQQKREQAG